MVTVIPVPLVSVEEDARYHPVVFSKVTLVSPVHSRNAQEPMVVTPLPIVTLVSPVQFQNAQLPMVVTLLPIVTLVSPVQFQNA